MLTLATMPVLTGSNSISPSELSQRVAVIKRFRELLKAQRDRFRAYLDALDKQQEIISAGTTEDLLRHVELEEKIVEDIFSIQKVIDPLEEMYRSVRTEAPGLKKEGKSTGKQIDPGEEEVVNLKEVLKSLKDEAALRSGQNRELLTKRMAELRAEINSMKNNPYNRRKSGFANPPSQIDIIG